MKIFHAVPKSDAGADEKRDINFYWPYTAISKKVVRVNSQYWNRKELFVISRTSEGCYCMAVEL